MRVDVYPTKDGVIVPDLAAGDFELFEDGVRQTIDTVERIVISQRTTGETRREPNTVAESRAMAAEPNARVFVLFLDTYHTGIAGSHRMRTAITRFLERVLGPDDLVGVMTPEMSAADVTFARRTQVLEGFLRDQWNWGRRDSITNRDPEEVEYENCYPDSDPAVKGVAREMIERRREGLALSAVEDLVRWLEGVREERKAVLLVSEGWRLLRPNQALTRADSQGVPPPPAIGTTTGGRLTTDRGRSPGDTSRNDCEADRQRLAYADDWQQFTDLLDRANRANVSFYPVDPRGLPVFDTSIAGEPGSPDMIPLEQDQARLRTRLDTLRTLADATDGEAVMGSNDIERGLSRIVSDMTSYYLLGYSSTNAALDGRFRSIKVRVSRPGVEVRARRGYRAATPSEVEALTTAAGGGTGTTAPTAFDEAMGVLASASTAGRLSTHLAWAPTPLAGSPEAATLWATIELDPTVAKGADWTSGWSADVIVTGADGSQIVQRRESVTSGGRLVRLEFPGVSLPSGELTARVRLAPAAGGLPFTDVARVTVSDTPPRTGEPRLSRRSQTTGARWVPTADRRFRRADRLRVELTLPPGTSVKVVEMLDQRGSPLQVPVSFTPDPGKGSEGVAGGVAGGVADLSLAPFAPGDYALRVTIEVPGGTQQMFVPFRVVP